MQLQQPGMLANQQLTSQQMTAHQQNMNAVQGQTQLQVNNQMGAQIKSNQFVMNQGQQPMYQAHLSNNPGAQFSMQHVPKSDPETDMQTQN